MEFTQQEKEYLQKLLYNDKLKNDYMVKTELIKELPSELISILDKLKEGESSNEV